MNTIAVARPRRRRKRRCRRSTAGVRTMARNPATNSQAMIRVSSRSSWKPRYARPTTRTLARIVRHGTGRSLRPSGSADEPFSREPSDIRGHATQRVTSASAMGQPITVVEKPSATPGIVRFELNRSLTGMGHERYPSRDAATGDRIVDELVRRLFDTGKAGSVHVYSNVVTVDLKK